MDLLSSVVPLDRTRLKCQHAASLNAQLEQHGFSSPNELNGEDHRMASLTVNITRQYISLNEPTIHEPVYTTSQVISKQTSSTDVVHPSACVPSPIEMGHSSHCKFCVRVTQFGRYPE